MLQLLSVLCLLFLVFTAILLCKYFSLKEELDYCDESMLLLYKILVIYHHIVFAINYNHDDNVQELYQSLKLKIEAGFVLFAVSEYSEFDEKIDFFSRDLQGIINIFPQHRYNDENTKKLLGLISDL